MRWRALAAGMNGHPFPGGFLFVSGMAEANETEKKFRWSKAAADAAVLLADDEITNEHIAESVGVSVTTLWRWRQEPEFQERVAEHTAALHAAMLRHAIAKRHKRIAVLDRLHTKAIAVIDARAEGMAGEDAPGADTGLLVKSYKQVGQGPAAQLMEEFAVDTGLLREIRAIEEQAAKELGQWIEKSEHGGPDGGPVRVEVIGINAEDI